MCVCVCVCVGEGVRVRVYFSKLRHDEKQFGPSFNWHVGQRVYSTVACRKKLHRGAELFIRSTCHRQNDGRLLGHYHASGVKGLPPGKNRTNLKVYF